MSERQKTNQHVVAMVTLWAADDVRLGVNLFNIVVLIINVNGKCGK